MLFFSANYAIILHKNQRTPFNVLETRRDSFVERFFPARAFHGAFLSEKRKGGGGGETRLRRHRGTTKVVSPENPCCLFFSRMQVRFPIAGPVGKIMLVDHQVRPRATDHRWPSGRGALTLVSSLLIAKRPLIRDSGKERKATGRRARLRRNAEEPGGVGCPSPLSSDCRTN